MFSMLLKTLYIFQIDFTSRKLKMYIKTKRSACGTNQYHNLKLHTLEKTHFIGLNSATKYTVENIERTFRSISLEINIFLDNGFRTYLKNRRF